MHLLISRSSKERKTFKKSWSCSTTRNVSQRVFSSEHI